MNDMLDKNYQEKLEILKTLYKFDSLHPFPSEDCKKVLKENNEKYEDFTFELISYFSAIAGYSSWGKRALNWNIEQINEAESLLGKSFFDTYPKFEYLKQTVSEKHTPKLYNQLILHDLMRLTLLDVIGEIKNSMLTKSILTN